MDGGATHNFIYSALVERRKLQDETFDGFKVIILDNNSMGCTKWIPKLQVTLGNYTITDHFYVVNVADTNVVLGVKWLYYLGEHTMNYQVLEMKFKIRMENQSCGEVCTPTQTKWCPLIV